jgi:hypothetical protein
MDRVVMPTNGSYVAFGVWGITSADGPHTWTSPDGAIWTKQSPWLGKPTYMRPKAIASNGALVVAVGGQGGTATSWTSGDGVSWEEALWHPWLRINRVLRVMLHTRWSAEAWSAVRLEFRKAVALRARSGARDRSTRRSRTPGASAAGKFRRWVINLVTTPQKAVLHGGRARTRSHRSSVCRYAAHKSSVGESRRRSNSTRRPSGCQDP